MPLYEFRCSTCLKTQSKILPISKRNKKIFCCRKTMNKLISAPGAFILKGDGFYKSGFNL